MRVQLLLVLCFGVVGLLAAPDRSSKIAAASGFGPGGYQHVTDPNGVFISGPGYYAGATTFSSGAPPNFGNFPGFPVFPNFPPFQFPSFQNIFGGPGTYAQNYPFNIGSMFQAYLNALTQNAAAIAGAAKPYNYPTKYSSIPKGQSSSFSSASSSSSSSSPFFPNFPAPPAPFFPPLHPPQPIDFSLGNRFGEEEGSSVGASISSSSTSFGGSKPGGVQGTFSSSVHGSTNVNGKEESFHVSTTGVHENGKVTSVTVHKP